MWDGEHGRGERPERRVRHSKNSRTALARVVAACVAALALLAGCGSTGGSGPLQVTDELHAAKPASSPPTTQQPAGRVISAPAASLSVYDPATHTLALAHAHKPVVLLYDTRVLHEDPRKLRLPSIPASLRRSAEAGELLAALPGSDMVVSIDLRTGKIQRTPVANEPVDAIDFNGKLVVARKGSRDIAVLDNGKILRTIGGFRAPSRLLRKGNEVIVLDRLTTSLTPVNPITGDKGAALRAGEGATHAVVDRFGRILVIDTRGEEFMAFSADPLLMKQRYPVSGSPYGLAYDPVRDLVWVTITARNQLVAYDVAGGQPVEVARVPTVRQPNSVTVNPRTGKVYVASATGNGLQVVAGDHR